MNSSSTRELPERELPDRQEGARFLRFPRYQIMQGFGAPLPRERLGDRAFTVLTSSRSPTRFLLASGGGLPSAMFCLERLDEERPEEFRSALLAELLIPLTPTNR